ncbi:protein-tyrosine phosphatase-like protein [Dipodascopsis uninucleata]
MAMHKVPGYEIFIGSIFSLQGQKTLAEENVTHILSAVREKVDSKLVQKFKHLQIQVDDDDDEDILKYFKESNEFIEDGINGGGCVLVHCVAGISRSVTLVTAYIMWKRKCSTEEALDIIRQGRTIANPNESFREQLDIYTQEGYEIDNSSPIYRRWLLRKETEISTANGMAPIPTSYSSVNQLNANKPSDDSKESVTELRCKKCRCALAQTSAIVPHIPKSPLRSSQTKIGPGMRSILSPQCMHYFLDPVLWMKTELEKGNLEGKLECPKCKSKVGTYRWQGLKCTCGDWVTPGIVLQRSRVDEAHRILR